MKILLYNDNPVVRKLVALSAQKTKDDLNVIWSIDELDNDAYDLLIVDDALYTDEVMAELKAKVPFKTTLIMATRGSSVPAGFDKVIHKPFLPTDLVDLFSQIEKSVSAVVDEPMVKEKIKAINLEDEMGDLSDTIAIEDLPDLGDLDFEDVASEIKTNILDHEEVQEVQSLLDDEESFSLDDDLLEGVGEVPDTSLIDDIEEVLDEMEEEEDMLSPVELPELDELDGLMDDSPDESSTVPSSESIEMPEMDDLDSLMNEMPDPSALDEVDTLLEDELTEEIPTTEEDLGNLDDLLLEEDLNEEPLKGSSDEADLDALMEGFDDETLESGEETSSLVEIPQIDDEDFGIDEEESLDMADLENLAAMVEDETLLDDKGMDDLEQQIQEAVGELDLGDLDMELGYEELEDLGIKKLENLTELDGLAGLEGIDEREMKLAVGESVEDELEVSTDDTEAMDEAVLEEIERDEDTSLVTHHEAKDGNTASAADGVEALQVLLKTLANEEVVKSLKRDEHQYQH